MRKAGLLIRHHHERFDGKGFPDGLRNTEIPLGSRIIAVSDFIDRTIMEFQVGNAIELTMKRFKEEIGKRFDPELLPFIENPAREVYGKLLPKADVIEIELHPVDLEEGMVISRDVKSGTGLILLKKGVELNRVNIHGLIRHFQIDPPNNGVFVWVKRVINDRV